jgi:lysophospholipase L1-like esterase
VVRTAGWVLATVAMASAPAGVGGDDPPWVGPMKEVRGRFTGTPGTLALFGDSITVSLAFWAPLESPPKPADPATTAALETVKGHMKPECWRKWRGPEYGSQGSMTIRWADENVETWLKKLNPECAVIMFGTNDLAQLDAKEYEAKTRSVVERCLKNGTVVILTTIPPRSGAVEKSRQFAEVQRKVAADLKVPLIDYQAEILRRRPDDWDGTLPKYKEFAKDVYEAPTLVSGDGVHPSYPRKFRDFSDDSLRSNGYLLRSYLTLHAYAAVIRKVLAPGK